MKKTYAIIFFFLGLGVIWFFYPQEVPPEDSKPDIPSIPGGKRMPASKQVGQLQVPTPASKPSQSKPISESPAKIAPPKIHPLSSFLQETLDFEGFSLIRGVFAHHTKDTSHGEWLYSEKGLHYYRADDVGASNVVFSAKEKRYGRLTGEFIFIGDDPNLAETIASELGLKKTETDVGMGKMIVLIAGSSFFQNGDGLDLLQSKYKDLLQSKYKD